MENKKFELTKLNLGGNMENKKMKLTKSNLDLVQLIQHIIFINISTYNQLRDKNLNDESIRDNFELICDNYIKLNNPSSYIWAFESSDKVIKYILMDNIMSDIRHILIISLEKEYKNCLKIGLQFPNRIIEPVPINIFNVQFEIG